MHHITIVRFRSAALVEEKVSVDDDHHSEEMTGRKTHST